jgi:hypothetical protein
LCLQVDLFLCGDDNCNVVADLITLRSVNGSPTLAFGYTRIPGTVVGLPTRYLSENAQASLQLYHSASDAATGTAAASVSWSLPTEPLWVDASPIMTPLGVIERMFASQGNNAGWKKLRMGTYLGNGICYTIISFVHPWMDAQGWDKSDDCVSTQVLMFGAHLPQAYFDWTKALYSRLKNGTVDITANVGAFAASSLHDYHAVDWLDELDSKNDNDANGNPRHSLDFGRGCNPGTHAIRLLIMLGAASALHQCLSLVRYY